MTKGDQKAMCVGLMLLVAMSIVSLRGVMSVGTDIHQGEVYRIIYIHVPCAFSAFLLSFCLFLASIKGLWRPQPSTLFVARACAEVGLFFTALTLVTGSLWGKPTWGVYWTWDARLTTTFVLAILYAAYLFLWHSISESAVRAKACAVLGILIFADIPIIYKSVTWWRTLHQGHSLGTGTMSSAISQQLVLSIACLVMFALWLLWQRSCQLQLRSGIENRMLLKGMS